MLILNQCASFDIDYCQYGYATRIQRTEHQNILAAEISNAVSLELFAQKIIMLNLLNLRLNIIISMKRNQSFLESSISGFYFAVHPLSLSFLRDYDSGFNLYFEKGLQIISKNQAPTRSPRKGEVVTFAVPNAIPHFRIQTDKNLEYEWSLYASQQEGDEHEEFIEGQKVSLKPAWQKLLESKTNVWEGQMDFNSIKCKLTFLTIIARSAAELQQILQQNLQPNANPIAPLPKEIPKEEKITARTIEEDVLDSRRESSSPRGVSSSIKIEPNRRESQKVDYANLTAGELKESAILIDYSPAQGEVSSPKSPKRQSIPREEHKLSLSEMHIAEEVEKEVEIYETSKMGEKVETIAEVPEEHPVQNLLGKEENQEITMTQSQLLNDKHEIILPPPAPTTTLTAKKKYMLLAIILVIVFSAIAYYSLRVEKGEKIGKAAKKPKAIKAKVEKVEQPPRQVKGKGKVEKGKKREK